IVFTYSQGQGVQPSVNNNKTSVQSSSSTNVVLMPIQLTDPPHAPYGTQAISILYSSLAIQISNANGSSWIYGNGSGQINLMSIINLTQVIGNVRVPVNASINKIKFNVTSASIEINNTNYSVTVPNDQITTNIHSNTKAASNSSILLDLSPTIATILTSNSTEFVLVPSLKAIIIGSAAVSSNTSNLTIGARLKINSSERINLENSVPNLTILSSSLSQSNSSTLFSVTIKNNGNQSVVLNHVLLYGNISSKISINRTPIIQINGSVDGKEGINISRINISSKTGINGKLNVQINSPPSIYSSSTSNSHVASGLSITVNTSNSKDTSNVVSSDNSTDTTKINETSVSEKQNSSISSNENLNNTNNNTLSVEEHVGVGLVNFKVLNFLITQNANLTLPRTLAEFESVGYTIQPGATTTFQFNGAIIFGNENNAISAEVSPGSVYNIRVGGEEGASASGTVVAS
ncbi:MAG: hypothetical protein QXD23_01200, partial [Candidatus Micrarchaeaceae archaeon]